MSLLWQELTRRRLPPYGRGYVGMAGEPFAWYDIFSRINSNLLPWMVKSHFHRMIFGVIVYKKPCFFRLFPPTQKVSVLLIRAGFPNAGERSTSSFDKISFSIFSFRLFFMEYPIFTLNTDEGENRVSRFLIFFRKDISYTLGNP